jgi:serine/threonine-protein kinase haspin
MKSTLKSEYFFLIFNLFDSKNSQFKNLTPKNILSHSELPNCKKIGEGAYGEVFCYTSDNGPIVLKIIPIEGEQLVNEEQQKRFDEILSEVVISMELSNLRNGSENITDGFVNVKRVTCVKGVYPQHLIDEWDIYNDSYLKRSENENPEIFGEDQLYIVFELCNAGIDLEAFQFKHAEEAFSVFIQVS